LSDLVNRITEIGLSELDVDGRKSMVVRAHSMVTEWRSMEEV